MESSLHRALKERYARGGRLEVGVAGYRVDAVTPGGEWVEIQSGALAPLRGKLGRLLPLGRVRVVKPLVVTRRVVRRARRLGPDLSARRSPKRGAFVDVFDDLVGLARVFPHPNLVVEVVAVEADEVRLARRRRPGYVVADRLLRSVVSAVELAAAVDLWKLLPDPFDGPFTTLDLAARTGRGVPFAQRLAYCLRLSGAAVEVAKRGNRRVYERADAGAVV